MKSYKIAGLYIPIILLIASLILNYHFNRSLYLLGVDLIITMQKYSSPILDAFFIFFTFLVDPTFVAITLVITFILFPRKFQLIVGTIAVLFNTYIFHIMKVFLSQPRPFWTHSSVRNIGYYCPKDYGNPSGHTQFAVFFYAILLIHLNKAKNIVWIVGGLVVIIFVMISRMYLGGHSLDQVVFGFLVAIALGILYGYGGGMQFISKKLISFNKSAVKLQIFLFLSVFAVLNFVVYFNNKKKDVKFNNNFKIWQKNFESNCHFDLKADKINESSLLASTAILFLIAGFYFAYQYLVMQDHSLRYLLGRWNFSIRKWKWFSYIIYTVTNLVVLAVPYLLALPLYWLMGKTFAAKMITASIPSLFSPGFSICLSFYILKLVGLLSFEHEKKDEENKELLRE